MSSRNNSPRRLVRRKTTAAVSGPSRTRTAIEDQSYPDYSNWHNSYTDTRERPTSWHAPSLDQFTDTTNYGYHGQYPGTTFLDVPFTTTEVNGLVTPMALPIQNEPQIQELIAPLEDLSAEDFDTSFAYLQDFTQKPNIYANTSAYPIYPSSYLPYEVPQNLPAHYGYYSSNFGAPQIETAPASPDLLPIQTFDDIASPMPLCLSNSERKQEELVGLGLYDSPTEVQSRPSSLVSGLQSSRAGEASGGKGLKLEESFEPSSEEQEESSSQSEEGDDYDDDGNAFLPDLLVGQGYSQNLSGAAPELANRSFFFEHDEQSLGLMSDASNMAYSSYGWNAASNATYGWV